MAQRWTKPPVNLLKCNVNAAIFSLLGYAGFGCIIRNDLGSVVAAIHGHLPCIQNPSTSRHWEFEKLLAGFNVCIFLIL